MMPIEVGITVRLNNIFFDFDKTTLRPESIPQLDRVVKFMRDNPTVSVEIGGHTDSKGSDEYNINLSQGRAESVVNYVIEQGVDYSRIIAKGYGESLPVDTNSTDEGRQSNRRVEFKILEIDTSEAKVY
jgi:outer membrane protein OmpA-like peptidoglycan-associated protein